MRLSIVIATRDRAAYLTRAIESLEKQIASPSFEVIVVDNGSSDDTRAATTRAAKRAKFDVRYFFESEPNRGKARNRGIAEASGYLVLFCDDDVQAPPGFLAAHEAAHSRANLVVNGPILNVPSYEMRPKPSPANYSRAFLCTCNASLTKKALVDVGGFDERFDLYGWEDTELGVRLRDAGLHRKFAWDAYIWHIKAPQDTTLEVETAKILEKARMAARFVRKVPSLRARMATGAHTLNLVRGRYFLPDSLLALYAGVASDERAPAALRSLARMRFLDGMYTRELAHSMNEHD